MDFEAVPMGFETIAVLIQERFANILKQSLWDLKRAAVASYSVYSLILKQSLWDLKRYLYFCFPVRYAILKQSLWDLKLSHPKIT